MNTPPNCRYRPVFTLVLTAGLLLAAGCGTDQPDNQATIDRAGTQNPPGVPLPVQPSRQPPADLPEASVELTGEAYTAPMSAAPVNAPPYAVASKIRADAGYAIMPSPEPPGFWPVESADRENYAQLGDNPTRLVAEQPVSTFSIDVDTGAYANVRRFLNQGLLPPSDAVRIEELVNYFPYDYPTPADRETPFSIDTRIAAAPWNEQALLLRIGIRGYDVDPASRPAANLVFLLDVSGSMNSPDKLPLLKNAFRLLTRRLDGDDRVAIVVYAGASGLVLESTSGDQQAKILTALDRLRAGGSTNGGDGIRLAYSIATDNYVEDGINRVIIATDGDFNVGTVNHAALIDLIERNRERGIALTTLGFGQGNYNDRLLEQLADYGNGNYAYIDTLREARKVLVEDLTSTLQTIAKDVKIQIEFNPATVAEYRLIGYQNRMLKREDFNNDRVDAGDIGAGHTVTAFYELKLVDSGDRLIEPLRYGSEPVPARGNRDELAHLRLRYKTPGGDQSRLIEQALQRSQIQDFDQTSDDFRFATAVAAFGQSLRGGRYLNGYALADIEALARTARGNDRHGYRSEFLSLVELADSIDLADRVVVR